MAIQKSKRPFRAELERKTAHGGDAEAQNQIGDDIPAKERHNELLSAIQQLRQDISTRAPVADVDADDALMEEYKREVREAANLRHELQELSDAIHATKKEVARLHPADPDQDKLAAMTDELGLVVTATEGATESILAASEAIEQKAESLRMQAQGEDERNALDDITEQVMNIFEACNFQDLTGQRITRVVNTLRFIEERIDNMIAVLGGEEELKEVEPEIAKEADTSDKRLLHGPTDGDTKIDQDAIDALFD